MTALTAADWQAIQLTLTLAFYTMLLLLVIATPLAWWLAGLLCFISIIGIPFGRSCFVIGQLAFWPFGQESINRRYLQKYDDIGTGGFGLVGNIFWFIFAGFWLALGHLLQAGQHRAEVESCAQAFQTGLHCSRSSRWQQLLSGCGWPGAAPAPGRPPR